MTRTGASEVIAAAVGQAAESLAGAAEDPEQLGLLPPSRFEGPQADEQRAKLQRAHSGRGGSGGRPPGSPNKATVQLRKWLLAQGVDPLVQMARWAAHTPETLAKELGCTNAEAFDRLKSLWADLAAFVHPRMAPVNDAGQAVPFFQMTFGGGVAIGGEDVTLPPWMRDPEVAKAIAGPVVDNEQDQGLSGSGTVRLPDSEPNEVSQDADNAEE